MLKKAAVMCSNAVLIFVILLLLGSVRIPTPNTNTQLPLHIHTHSWMDKQSLWMAGHSHMPPQSISAYSVKQCIKHEQAKCIKTKMRNSHICVDFFINVGNVL